MTDEEYLKQQADMAKAAADYDLPGEKRDNALVNAQIRVTALEAEVEQLKRERISITEREQRWQRAAEQRVQSLTNSWQAAERQRDQAIAGANSLFNTYQAGLFHAEERRAAAEKERDEARSLINTYREAAEARAKIAFRNALEMAAQAAEEEARTQREYVASLEASRIAGLIRALGGQP